LVQLTEEQLISISENQGFDVPFLKSHYVYAGRKNNFAILEAAYGHTIYSKPPKDGKLREIRPAYNWLRLNAEFLHAKLNSPHATPIPYSWVYAADG